MPKIQIDVDDLKALLNRARAAGTLDAWATLAIEYCDALIAECVELIALLREVRADGVMEEWGTDLPQRIDEVLARLKQ